MSNQTQVERSKDVLISEQSLNFESLLLSENLLKGLMENKFLKPSPIQLKAIPIGKCGFDLIIKSKSGTGKTAVFGIIALEMIKTKLLDSQVLILSPTREIAVQTCDVIKSIGKYIEGLKVESFIGGLPVKEDADKIKNCQVVVGSPGRILHLIKSKTLNPANIKLFVLDEADKLMEKSFQADINQIYNSLSIRKQMLAVSATYPDELDNFLAKYMHTPTYVSPHTETPLLLGLKHFISVTNFHANIIQQTNIKNKELLRFLSNITFTQCLVFCNYQSRAENVSNFLNKNSWKSSFISAAQSQQQRLEVLKQLKEFHCRILLSTDLTARGIDAVNVDLVINYDVPNDESTYLHRMGRAGRYGAKGICVSVVSKGKELACIKNIIGSIGGTQMTIPKLPSDKFPSNIWDLDCSSLEQIDGTLPENKKISFDNIKDIVMNLRNEEKGQRECSNESESEKSVKLENSDCEDRHSALSQEDDPLSILQKLANGEHVTYEPEHISYSSNSKLSQLSSTEDILMKNVSLFNVAKILNGNSSNVEDEPEVAETIERLLVQMSTDEPVVQEEQVSDKNPIVDINNIFTHAYNYATGKTAQHWLDAIGDTFTEDNGSKEKQAVNLLQDFLEYANDDEEPEYDNFDDYQSESDVYYDHGEVNEDIAPNLQWIPVEKSVQPSADVEMTNNHYESNVHYDENYLMVDNQGHYNEIYENSLTELDGTFNTLETVEDFNQYWQSWQNNMSNIRDYVQQNIYLEEMNRYKYGRHYHS